MNIIVPTSDADLIAKVRAHLRSSATDGVERRFTPGMVERRAAADGKPGGFRGYAAVFNSKSENFGSDDYPYFEVIDAGFFDNVLNDDIRCLFNHDQNLILGRSKAGKGTCRVSQDATGLGYDCEASEISYARDLGISIDRGDVTQSSFAFRITDDGDRLVVENGIVTRTLKKGGCARLYDVSPVTYPAYAATEVALRELRGLRKPTQPTFNPNATVIRARELDLASAE